MADHWTILGAGAIGCLWAASLRENGKPCTLILREQRRQKIVERFTQLQPELELVDGHRRQLFRVAITDKHHIESPIKRLIVATKARDTLQAVGDIAHHLASDAVVLLLQNGMGSQEAVNTLLENHDVWAGTTTDGAWKAAENPENPARWTVHHTGHGHTWIGPLNPSAPPFPETPLFELMSINRLTIHPCDNIQEHLWLKLAINSAINALTAVYRCRNGELLSCPARWQQVNALCEETSRLMTRLEICCGISLQEHTREVLRHTANNYSSTCQDVNHGRLTELPFINGFLLDQARQIGMELPSHHALMKQLKQQGIH